MKDVLKFLAKWFGIVLIILFAAWMLTKIWNGTQTCECPTNIVTETENDTTVTETEDVVAKDVTDEVGNPSECEYVAGYTSKGIVVESGTKVTGPAVVKPSRDKDHALVINVGVEYITSNSDEVVWLLVGDNACALSNAEPFFSTYEIKTQP